MTSTLKVLKTNSQMRLCSRLIGPSNGIGSLPGKVTSTFLRSGPSIDLSETNFFFYQKDDHRPKQSQHF